MFIFKIHFHGAFGDMVVMAERRDRAMELARQHLVEKHGGTTRREMIDQTIDHRCNIAKLGVVTADIAHLYTEECVIIG